MNQRHSPRLKNIPLSLNIDGLRRGWYSDRYFANVVTVLKALSESRYTYSGTDGRLDLVNPLAVGDLVVEAQIFNRRAPRALVVGIDVALKMIRAAAGYFDGDQFVETWRDLQVTALPDASFADYDENPLNVCPVIKIRGRYRDFALLETPLLGVLTRASRIATNVYESLEVSNGKPVLFFPARFDLPEVQSLDGYAYWSAVTRYNAQTGSILPASISTDAQGAWWGGHGSGTIPHALIAAFLGDSAEAMVAFAQHVSLDIPRILLADFNNDVIGDSLKTLDAFWVRYTEAFKQSDTDGMRRWSLNGIRIDTSPSVRDAAMHDDEPAGISPLLVTRVRAALDSAWRRWIIPESLREVAQAYCHKVRIVVTGGFSRDRIIEYERAGVPVDVYGVGSRFLRNDAETNTDFTMDVVRILADGEWHDIAKVGRRANENPEHLPVDLADYAP